MYSDVVLLRGEDILETSFKALEKIGFEKISAEKVLVKPNITAPYPLVVVLLLI